MLKLMHNNTNFRTCHGHALRPQFGEVRGRENHHRVSTQEAGVDHCAPVVPPFEIAVHKDLESGSFEGSLDLVRGAVASPLVPSVAHTVGQEDFAVLVEKWGEK